MEVQISEWIDAPEVQPDGREFAIGDVHVKPFCGIGILCQRLTRFIHPDPPRCQPAPGRFRNAAGQRRLGRFHNGSVDYHAGRHIFPKRHKQLAGKRNDGCFFKATAVQSDPLQKPTGESGVRLMA